MLSSVCAKSPQIPNATLKHGHFSSPFITVHFLLLLPLLTCDGCAFQTHLIAFQTPVTPTPVSKTPTHTHTRTRTQLSAAQILYIPWPSLPPLPELTPPQPRVVEKIIFYACHSSPHTDTAYERRTEPAFLPTFVCALCTCLSLSIYIYMFAACFYMLN